nr:MAG TPA: hypothetical protein [Caudoviricetes sp.]
MTPLASNRLSTVKLLRIRQSAPKLPLQGSVARD